jgi:hypothetical protein
MQIMKKENEQKEIKTDLKHDTMEFSASTDGEDRLDIDDASYEEEEISPEELELLDDADENEAAALINVENELTVDEDFLPEEDWTDDLPGDNTEEEDEDYERS